MTAPLTLHQRITPFLGEQVDDGMLWVRLERIERAISAGADLTQVDEQGRTPLGLVASQATQSNTMVRSIIKALVGAGAPLFGTDQALDSFIQRSGDGAKGATWTGEDIFALVAADAGAARGHQVNEAGQNALHVLAYQAPWILRPVAGTLLGAAPDPIDQLLNQPDADGNTPYHALLSTGGWVHVSLSPLRGALAPVVLDWLIARTVPVPNHANRLPVSLMADLLPMGLTQFVPMPSQQIMEQFVAAEAEGVRLTLESNTDAAPTTRTSGAPRL